MTSVRERRLPEPATPTAPVAPGLGAEVRRGPDAAGDQDGNPVQVRQIGHDGRLGGAEAGGDGGGRGGGLGAAIGAYQDAVMRLGGLDPVTTELVRLRCARQHQCYT